MCPNIDTTNVYTLCSTQSIPHKHNVFFFREGRRGRGCSGGRSCVARLLATIVTQLPNDSSSSSTKKPACSYISSTNLQIHARRTRCVGVRSRARAHAAWRLCSPLTCHAPGTRPFVRPRHDTHAQNALVRPVCELASSSTVFALSVYTQQKTLPAPARNSKECTVDVQKKKKTHHAGQRWRHRWCWRGWMVKRRSLLRSHTESLKRLRWKWWHVSQLQR